MIFKRQYEISADFTAFSSELNIEREFKTGEKFFGEPVVTTDGENGIRIGDFIVPAEYVKDLGYKRTILILVSILVCILIIVFVVIKFVKK